jgi:enhancing lycopene biosynthesis protein 2
LKELNVSELDAAFFPGGFGAAKNLSTFAVSSDPSVNAEVSRVLEEFHAAKKPIGLCCIAPILAALVLGKKGVRPKITLGKSG